MNISIRWVDSNFVAYEDPIGFIDVPNIERQTLKDVLVRVNLPLSDCRGQAHDGAQNMFTQQPIARVILNILWNTITTNMATDDIVSV